jgi:hexosaminidase
MRYPLVPVPKSLEVRDGAFTIGPATSIVLVDPADAELRRLAESWAEPLRKVSRLPVPVAESSPSDAIVLEVTGSVRPEGDGPLAGTAAEAYSLSVAPSGIRLSSPTHAGLFRGLMTLRQLLPTEFERGVRSGSDWGEVGGPAPATGVAWSVPAVEIEDEPRFPYRGMHLDVGRHVFSVEFVKKYIDLLALHRLNVLHWHLTEDQGWRIEIRRYPRLTEVGGCRAETQVGVRPDPWVGDGEPYCGWYTQDEVREIVDYAAERYITVIPEIEMPGHSLAALAAYPELGCTEGPFEVGTRWGVYEDIYCPKPETFAFLEVVLSEVIDLFPSTFIHIGGDEAPKTRWEESPVAQEIIEREGLADEHELQSWFIQRIERFLDRQGRRLIGWDEILEGGLPPQATVMSWRGMDGGIEAAREGHDVVMSPTTHAYFDYYQADPENEPLAIGGFLPLDTVYALEPVPPELTPEEGRHIIGVQANVWTEYMKTPDHVEYMAFPRMAALAEVAWSPAEAKNWDRFRARLADHLRRLDVLGVRYRPLDDVGVPGSAPGGSP